MRQRVMIAMALALEPEIVIMDEPTTALDVVMQRQILRQLVELREQLGFSVVFITHDLSLLIEFSDRIAIMYGGRIVEQAGAAEIYRDPRHPYSDGPAALLPRAARPAPRADRHPRLAAAPVRDAGRLRLPPALRQGPRPVRRPSPGRSPAPDGGPGHGQSPAGCTPGPPDRRLTAHRDPSRSYGEP